MSFGHYMCSTPLNGWSMCSMIISQKKKNATKYSHLVFSLMKKFATKENIHCNDAYSSWWINYITSSKLLYEKMNVSKEVQIECFKI